MKLSDYFDKVEIFPLDTTGCNLLDGFQIEIRSQDKLREVEVEFYIDKNYLETLFINHKVDGSEEHRVEAVDLKNWGSILSWLIIEV